MCDSKIAEALIVKYSECCKELVIANKTKSKDAHTCNIRLTLMEDIMINVLHIPIEDLKAEYKKCMYLYGDGGL